MKRNKNLPRVLGGLLFAAVSSSLTATVVVPGTADPWLAGMPDGARASFGDIAPTHSPCQLLEIPIIQGVALTFTAAGAVSYHPTTPLDGPDGNANSLTGHFPDFPKAENGIANCIAPVDSVVGVFLGSDPPNLTPAPPYLDFSAPESREYRTLTPALKQVFFIGDGHTAGGVLQHVLVPSGATRLFLGTMDGSGWYNNKGSFTVRVSSPDLTNADAFDPGANQGAIGSLTGGGSNPGRHAHGRFVSVMPQPDGCLRLQFSGDHGPKYVLEASSNLRDWEMIDTTVAEQNGMFIFEDRNAARFQSRFYRIVGR